jgi:HAD superfamily hydrolase (TIGR01509 family)
MSGARNTPKRTAPEGLVPTGDGTLKAVLWDVDGTLAETERDGHRVAFNQAFTDLQVPWQWDDETYGRLLAVSGGRERLLHDMQVRSEAPALPQQREELAAELHRLKNRYYAARVKQGAVTLRRGVRELIEDCLREGVLMAITTTTSRSNLKALMQVHLGPTWQQHFAVVVCGEDVRQKKPHPEVYRRALEALQLSAVQVVAIEDSPGGAASAVAAHVPVVVTRSAYFGKATIEGALAIGPGFGQRAGWRPALAAPAAEGTASRVTLADLRRWHALADTVSQFA